MNNPAEYPFDAYLSEPRRLPPFGTAQLALSGHAKTAEEAWQLAARHWLDGKHRGKMQVLFNGTEEIEGAIGME